MTSIFGKVKINIGDTVKIIREGLLYSQYKQWAERNGATGWKDKGEPNIDEIFQVVTMAEHTPDNHKGYVGVMLALIEDDKGRQFIFDINGISFVASKPYFKKEEFEVI